MATRVWFIETSLDGWELDSIGPLTFAEACVFARCLFAAHEGRMGKPHITTLSKEKSIARGAVIEARNQLTDAERELRRLN